MQLRELQWFTTLADTEHITEASVRLNISQPTLSRALARLERKLGVQLFDRHQNRLRLNKYGELFQAHALRALNEIDRGEQRIAALVDPDRGSVSLGFAHSFGGWLIPDLLNRYRGVASSTSFELHGGACDSVVDSVRQGRIDIGFVAPEPTADDLEWVPLGREALCLGVPAGHVFEGRDHVAMADVADEPMIALKAGYGLRQVTDRLCREAGFSPRIEIEVTELSTLHALVAAGMGVAVVPAAHSGHAAAIGTVALSDPTAFRCYGAVVRRNGPSGQAARRFLKFVAGVSPLPARSNRSPSEGDPKHVLRTAVPAAWPVSA
ncbi:MULTISPECIES: LysR family transcriptional regulator [unclassified Nocardia]|uniref:LysR family transcriptional regulator n=1 Tax=unclassified Nocardia TaxID=2637762 RepID=UPI0034313CD7